MDRPAIIDLSKFNISKKWGFLEDYRQITPLGGIFIPWERALSLLSSHIQTKIYRKEIESLPEVEFSDTTLKSKSQWQRAFVLVSFLGQAYLKMDDDLPEKLPKKLAKPWVAVSEHLGMKPCVSYAAVVLYNFSLQDESKPAEIRNITARITFTGLEDESWFYIVHMAAEIAAVPGLIAIVDAYTHMAYKDYNAVSRCLKVISKALDKMTEESSQFFKKVDGKSKCDPDTFYNQLRRFFSQLLKGIIYEGTENLQPIRYLGASAAQTSSIYAFDIFLSVQHSGEGAQFITEVRQYMPREHREFLEKLDSMPSVRQFCKDSNDKALKESYDTALKSILNFRTFHLKSLIGEYIFRPKLRAESKSEVPQAERSSLDEEKGTGGTKLSIFLKNIVKETEELMIAK